VGREAAAAALTELAAQGEAWAGRVLSEAAGPRTSASLVTLLREDPSGARVAVEAMDCLVKGEAQWLQVVEAGAVPPLLDAAYSSPGSTEAPRRATPEAAGRCLAAIAHVPGAVPAMRANGALEKAVAFLGSTDADAEDAPVELVKSTLEVIAGMLSDPRCQDELIEVILVCLVIGSIANTNATPFLSLLPRLHHAFSYMARGLGHGIYS
jgi:hypothetical protein